MLIFPFEMTYWFSAKKQIFAEAYIEIFEVA